MKFLKLEILNLASLDRPEGEVIDFTGGPLGAGNIFCIVGPTGSGKSTILDAICLALYGNTPRYTRRKRERKTRYRDYGPDASAGKGIGETDARNILTRGRKYGHSKLTFQGPDGIIYRSEWSIRFKQRNYDEAQTALYRITADGSGNIIEEKLEISAAELLGIDFERFQRTVIIAQGAFAGFLQSDPEARWKLLEGIVGTGKLYQAIGNETYRRYQEAAKRLDDINARIKVYQESILSPDDLARLDTTITRLTDEDTSRRGRIKLLEQALAWYETDDKMAADIVTFEAAGAAAAAAKEALAPEARNLALRDATASGRRILREIRGAVKATEGYDKEISSIDTVISEAVNNLSAADTLLVGLQEAARKATEDAKDKKPVITEARNVKALIATAKALRDSHKAALARAAAEAVKADRAVKDNEKGVAAARKAVDNAVEDRDRHASEVKAELSRRVKALEEAQQMVNELTSKMAGRDLKDLQESSSQAAATLKAIEDMLRVSDDLSRSDKAIADKEAEIIALGESVKKITGEITGLDTSRLKEDIKSLENSLTLMTSEDWKRHRRELTEGSPCPLCGATHHPYQAEDKYQPAVNELENLIAAKQGELSGAEKRIKELESIRSTNNGRMVQLGKSVADDRKDRARAGLRRAELTGLYPHLDLPADRLNAMLPEAEKKSREAAAALNDFLMLDSQLKNTRAGLDKAAKALEKYKTSSENTLATHQARVNEASETLARLEGTTEPLARSLSAAEAARDSATLSLAEAEKNLNALEVRFNSMTGGTDPDELEAALTRAVTSANELVNQKRDEMASLRESIERSRGMRDNLVKVSGETKAGLARAQSALNKWLEEHPCSDGPLTLGRLAEIEDMDGDRETVREECRAADEALTRATTTLENALTQRERHASSRPEAPREELQAEYSSIKEISDEPLREARARRKAHDIASAKASEVAPELAEARAMADDTKKLNDAAGGADGLTLRRIAQCYTLRFLIEHANREISKFNPRYELKQIDRSLAIRVIDHDRGGTIRETTSLSGGETFIVSLGLALGLSALSSCSAASFDNLFIDEGFGTLDAETLATVVESLANLQSSLGKKVGVISHTDAMTERISTRIRVSPVSGHPGSSAVTIEA